MEDMITLSTFWDVLGAMFIVFFVVLPLIMLWGFALADLFLRKASAVHKVIWLLVIIFFPIIGPIVYILVHPLTKPGRSSPGTSPKPLRPNSRGKVPSQDGLTATVRSAV